MPKKKRKRSKGGTPPSGPVEQPRNVRINDSRGQEMKGFPHSKQIAPLYDILCRADYPPDFDVAAAQKQVADWRGNGQIRNNHVAMRYLGEMNGWLADPESAPGAKTAPEGRLARIARAAGDLAGKLGGGGEKPADGPDPEVTAYLETVIGYTGDLTRAIEEITQAADDIRGIDLTIQSNRQLVRGAQGVLDDKHGDLADALGYEFQSYDGASDANEAFRKARTDYKAARQRAGQIVKGLEDQLTKGKDKGKGKGKGGPNYDVETAAEQTQRRTEPGPAPAAELEPEPTAEPAEEPAPEPASAPPLEEEVERRYFITLTDGRRKATISFAESELPETQAEFMDYLGNRGNFADAVERQVATSIVEAYTGGASIVYTTGRLTSDDAPFKDAFKLAATEGGDLETEVTPGEKPKPKEKPTKKKEAHTTTVSKSQGGGNAEYFGGRNYLS